MTPRTLSARLAKLEAERTEGWHAWRDVPVQQWPDAALLSLLDLPADYTDAELLALLHALAGCGNSISSDVRRIIISPFGDCATVQSKMKRRKVLFLRSL